MVSSLTEIRSIETMGLIKAVTMNRNETETIKRYIADEINQSSIACSVSLQQTIGKNGLGRRMLTSSSDKMSIKMSYQSFTATHEARLEGPMQ